MTCILHRRACRWVCARRLLSLGLRLVVALVLVQAPRNPFFTAANCEFEVASLSTRSAFRDEILAPQQLNSLLKRSYARRSLSRSAVVSSASMSSIPASMS
jgi:hypothetical protein